MLYNIIVARICDFHFDANCFEMVLTKPRSNNVAAKQIRRLKKGSVPTKMLILGEKRKRTVSEIAIKDTTNERKKMKVT